jgi:hypothetical protein
MKARPRHGHWQLTTHGRVRQLSLLIGQVDRVACEHSSLTDGRCMAGRPRVQDVQGLLTLCRTADGHDTVRG